MPDREFDSDHAADWIAERADLDRDVVAAVLDAETDYMIEHGLAEEQED